MYRKTSFFNNVTVPTVTFCLFCVCMVSGLQCYTCSTKNGQDVCKTNATLTRAENCSAEDAFCQVVRVETFGQFTSLTRGCVPTCRPHCGVWGEDVDEESCYSCCQTDLCNTQNSSDRPKQFVTYLVGVTLCLLLR